MTRAGPGAFAASVAARYATAPRRVSGGGRVLLHGLRRVGALAPARVSAPRLALQLTHRIGVEDHGRTVRAAALALAARVERHTTATRHVVERTHRVVQVAPGPVPVRPAGAGATSPAAGAAPAPILVPALPRVLRRAAAVEAPAVDAVRLAPPAASRAPAAAAAPAVDVARLTDEVMRGIDRRLAAWRERHGRG